MGTFGLVLQLVGVLIAGAALLVESRTHLVVQPQELSTKRLRHLPNPWRANTGVRYQAPNRIERDDWRNYLRGTGIQAGRRSDPELLAAGEYILKQQKAREELLATDWERQLADSDAVRDELKRLFEEQSRLLSEQEASSARRIRVEALGLLIAAVGTIISGIAS